MATYIGFLRALWCRLICVIRFLLESFIHQCGWCHGDTFSRWLEAILVGSVLNYSNFSGLIHISVLALHFASGQLGLDFEGSISSLIAISVGAIFVVPDVEYYVWLVILNI